ncbi:MAG: chorismate mutase, partial [Gammaproteobacteria bacterium]
MVKKKLPNNLEDNRNQIDLIDETILNLISDRSELVINAGKIKKKSGNKTFYRPDREAKLIKNLLNKNKSSIPSNKIKNIFKEIIS